MLFSSIPFLFYFLPCVFVLYFLVPMRWKNTVLLLASLFFYAWGEPKFVVFMLASIVQGYVLARLVEKYRADRGRAKLFLTLSLVFSLGLLGYCKYADFFLSGFNALTGLHIPLLRVALPIGISFYTFQILSYVVDVYRGDVKAQRNFIDLAAYVAMFPQLIAGPGASHPFPRRRRRRRAALRAGAGQKGAAGERLLRAYHDVQGERRPLRALLLALRRRLRAEHLFRFLRLQRHGHRPWAHLRLPLS